MHAKLQMARADQFAECLVSGDLIERVAAIYQEHPHHILPYIGDAFTTPRPSDLRVLTVGINAYVSEKDWPPEPEWHRAWIAELEHPFQKGVAKEAEIVARALTEAPLFAGLRYERERCLYATNAIKVYMTAARGKRAADLERADFDAHKQQWHDELNLLAEAGALPHVAIIFSQVYWEYAWKAFHPQHGGPRLGVSEFRSIKADAPHRLNQITIRRDGRGHQMLLVRLLHPTGGRGSVGTATWLRERASFRGAAGIAEE